MKNVVDIDYSDLTRAEAAGADLESLGVFVKRDANGYIEEIIAPLQNLASLNTEGLDFSFSAGHFFNSIGDIQFNTAHSLYLTYNSQGFPGVGFDNKLGSNGRPRWKNTTNLSYIPKFHQDSKLGFTFHTTGAHKKSDPSAGRIKRHHQLDMQYTNNAVLGGALTLGLNNVLNRDPPLDDTLTSDQLDDTLYSPRGQSAYINYKYKF